MAKELNCCTWKQTSKILCFIFSPRSRVERDSLARPHKLTWMHVLSCVLFLIFLTSGVGFAISNRVVKFIVQWADKKSGELKVFEGHYTEQELAQEVNKRGTCISVGSDFSLILCLRMLSLRYFPDLFLEAFSYTGFTNFLAMVSFVSNLLVRRAFSVDVLLKFVIISPTVSVNVE